MTGGVCDETSISTDPTKRHNWKGGEEGGQKEERANTRVDPKKIEEKNERERENKNLYFPYIRSLYHGKPIFLN